MPFVHAPARLSHEHGHLRAGVGGVDVLDHDVGPLATLTDLNFRAARAARRLPSNTADPALPTPGCVDRRRPKAPACGNADPIAEPQSSGTSQERGSYWAGCRRCAMGPCWPG